MALMRSAKASVPSLSSAISFCLSPRSACTSHHISALLCLTLTSTASKCAAMLGVLMSSFLQEPGEGVLEVGDLHAAGPSPAAILLLLTLPASSCATGSGKRFLHKGSALSSWIFCLCEHSALGAVLDDAVVPLLAVPLRSGSVWTGGARRRQVSVLLRIAVELYTQLGAPHLHLLLLLSSWPWFSPTHRSCS